MNDLAIEVSGLRKSFGEKEAVAGIDLQITAGSFAGLVGPNGAGKTTSLSMPAPGPLSCWTCWT